MKVSGSRPAVGISGAQAGRSNAAPGFAPEAPEAQAGAAVARTGALASVNSLVALLALQETPGPLERRRRAVRRAGSVLDALDELKLAFVGGMDDASALSRLGVAVQEAREQTDDDGLEAVLEQVEIRAAVELAKREVAARVP